MLNKKTHNRGFTLVQISVLLMVASLVLVSVLPTSQKTLDANRITTARMNDLMRYYRAYMSANGSLPCPADATLATGATNYGVTAANSGSATDCTGSTPAANYVDASNNVAIGMIPYKTLGIPRELVYDGWGRAITYAVDTTVTGGCWSSPATGAITVTDNGSAQTTVIALVSHGANGHGAWMPLTGSSGTGVRLNNNSADSNELTNAHVNASFVASSTLNNFVITTPSSTFDDLIVYKSPFWTMNARPAIAAGSGGSSITGISTPTSGLYYYTGAFSGILDIISGTISFTVTTDSAVTVSGTPRLALTATSVGGGTVSLTGNSGSGATGYANYASGSGSTSLVFTYPLQSTDMAPNGFTMGTSIDLNGGSITSLCTNSFTAPTLTAVIIPKVQAITASGSWTVPVDWNSTTNYIHAVGSGGNGATGTATAGGAGGGGGAFAQATGFADPVGTVITVTVGTAGGTALTQFKNATTLKADYGRNAAGTTRGNGGLASNSYPTSSYNGGNGGNNGGTTRGGGGGGGGSAGPGGGYVGKAGGAGANTGGGGGGGGGSNGGANTAGVAGTASAMQGGHGGRGSDGNAVSNRGAAGGGNATNGIVNAGTGGGGGGGSNGASVSSGSGGTGSISVFYGSTYVNWNTNVAPIGAYGVGGGGGGSGGANGATSNSGAAGAGGGYGGGGGGSGGATGTPGTLGAGSPGLIVVLWR